MELSVVVPTLNGRERLAGCLDALAENAQTAEVIVVNGPSADGTTGMVQEREDVDVLLEISDRNINVARNAGINAARGDVVAFVGDSLQVEPRWYHSIEQKVASGADAVTGPKHSDQSPGDGTVERERYGGRTVTYFDGDNVAFTSQTIESVDGFDEYLQTGGARDAAHRLAGRDRLVQWDAGMAVRRKYETDGGAELRDDPSQSGRDWGWKYRSLAYRLAKNYGIRPRVIESLSKHSFRDAASSAREVISGEGRPTQWVGNGRTVISNIAVGLKHGQGARFKDRSRRRNPNGLSSRNDRVVARYDWR